jgi:flagellar assembly protein FliH
MKAASPKMKWSEQIKFDQPLSDVCLLMGSPSQDWQQFLTEREAAAFERGRREGETSLNEQLLNQRNATIELQRGILNSLQRTLPQVAHEAETSLLLLAVEAAGKMVAGLPIDAQAVEAVVREALRQAEDTAEIVVQLHPDDLAMLREQHSPLLAGLPEVGPLRFANSAEVSRGGCILQTRFGLVDARRETKIEQLRNSVIA